MNNNRFILLDVSDTTDENERNFGSSQFWIHGLSVSYSLEEFVTNNDRQKNTIKLEKRNKLLFTLSTDDDQDF
ncbi:MAG: hypothetical protein R6W90_16340 [Ignavibacteriaceae bacterium]